MWVKICGTTNMEDALVAMEAGADAVGFVFAESSRQVTADQVADIVRQLPEGIEKAGVFQTGDPPAIRNIVACAGLTVAQLHGVFDARLVRTLGKELGGDAKIIQTVTFAAQADNQGAEDRRFTNELRSVLQESAVWAVLLDTSVKGSSGGTGISFDWRRAADLVRQVWPENPACKLILAGGLRPENVAQAVATLLPWGVDVVSGVEAIKGRKDAQRVRDFVVAAR